MGVTRRIVLPIIRLVLLAAIAAALLKLAFDDEDSQAGDSDPLTPSVEIVQPEVQVTTGTVVNTVEVDATIAADPPTPVRATDAGTVTVLLADPGDVVAAGDPLLEVVFEEVGEPTTETDDEGNVIEVPGETTRRFRTIEAPADGTVGEFEVLVGEDVAIGDQIGTITTGGFTVSGTLSAEQQYRLVSGPTSAEVQATGGPAPFACTDLRIGRDAAGGQDGGAAGGPAAEDQLGPAVPGDGSAASSTAISCPVPDGVTVFDGLAATMSIEAGLAENVLVVPVTAVEGSFESGNVWVVGPDGAAEERAVTLGLTDGEQVEIRGGLAEGETIMEFVPGQDEESMEDEMFGEFG